jgi:glycosyltransferase involved in cell wall biosynthesis
MKKDDKDFRMVWLCHYSLEHLEELPGLDLSGYQSHPAPWIPQLAAALQAYPGLELHILSTADFLEKDLHTRQGNSCIHIFSSRRGKGVKGMIGKLMRWTNRKTIRLKIKRIIHEIHPDLLCLHGTEHPFGGYFASLPFPVALWMQGVMQVIFRTEHHRAASLMKARERKLFSNLDYFITAQPHIQQIIRERNPKARFFPLFYPVNPEAFSDSAKVEGRHPDIVFTGSLIARKGISELLQAIHLLRTKGKTLSASLIGPAPDKAYFEEVKRFIRENDLQEQVHIEGYVKNAEEMLRKMKQARLFVYPSWADTAPLSLAEAMAAGMPVIATRVDGIPAMVEDGHSGMLVEVRDAEALATAISTLIQHPEKCEAIGNAAKAFALAHFSPEKVAGAFLDVCREIIAEEGRKK